MACFLVFTLIQKDEIMSAQARKYNLLFALLEAAYWSSHCVLYSFMVTILTDYGYDAILCGFVTMLLAIGTVVIQPMLGYISDHFIPGRKLLIALFFIAVPMTLLLPMVLKLPMPYAITYILVLSFFGFSQHSTIDAWSIQVMQDNPGMDFAFTRSGGSIGYALISLAAGFAVKGFGVSVLFYFHAVLLLFGGILCVILPEVPCPNKGHRKTKEKAGEGEGRPDEKGSLWLLLSNKTYMIFVLSLTFYYFSVRIVNTFLPIVLNNAGGDSVSYGMANFLSAGLEIVFLVGVSRLLVRDISVPGIYIAVYLLEVARIFVLFLSKDVWVIVATQVLHAAATGLHIRGYVEYISRLIPQRLAATATTFGMGISMGIGSVTGNFAGGIIIEKAGVQLYALFCTVVMLLAAVVFAPVFWKDIKARMARTV